MPKKRVHEVAKELGLENKVLIAHLEKIGIAVKAAASSLDESEVERIKKALLATEYRETVEERIKSTVIRRRTVRTFIETPVEEVPEKEEEQPETVLAEKPEDVSSKQPVGKIDKVKKKSRLKLLFLKSRQFPLNPKNMRQKVKKQLSTKSKFRKMKQQCQLTSSRWPQRRIKLWRGK